MKFVKNILGIKEENKKSVQTNINLPFEFITIDGNDAVTKLFELRNSETITPVIMGTQKDLDILFDNLQMSEYTIESIISSSNEIIFPDWFSERVSDDKEYYQIPHGDWPQNNLYDMELSAHLDVLSRQPLKDVVIGMIPTKDSWAIPAHLKFGGWNECPPPQEHTAIFKKWENEFSAKVACITGDVIEFTVDKPPTTNEQALKLAEEQFIYCSDIVFQGVETIENLASALLNSKVWYFWWD